MYLSRHGAGCDLLSALTEPSGRKCKPGVWQVKVFPSMSENVQWLESTPATLIHLQIFALTAHCTLWSIPHVPRTGAPPQAEAHEALGSLSVNRWMGMVNIQSRSIYICATQPPCPQVGGKMFKSLTGTAGIPRRQFPAPAFAVFAENKVLMVDCFAAERKREAAGSGLRQLNNAPEPHLPSAMQQCRWLSVETCRKKTLALEQGVLWSWKITCQISHNLFSKRAEEDVTVIDLSKQPSKRDMFLPVVLPWLKRRGTRTDLCCGCRWWRPRSRARRCGTWPPSAPSAWPCCCGWHRAELPPSRASPCPRPGSPPVTGYRSSPSPAEQAACGKHSCQSQHHRERGGRRGEERESRVSGQAFTALGLLAVMWQVRTPTQEITPANGRTSWEQTQGKHSSC